MSQSLSLLIIYIQNKTTFYYIAQKSQNCSCFIVMFDVTATHENKSRLNAKFDVEFYLMCIFKATFCHI